VREHVREHLRAAFRLHDACQAAAKQRAAADASRRSPVPPGAETARDGNLLAWRAARAMSRGERVRLRTRDGAEHVGRIVCWSPNHTPAELALDTGQALAIAQVKVIATVQQAPRDRHDRRLAACAHTLGYRGHCLTKSRRYSTTFTALREARERHVHEQLLARSRDAAPQARRAGPKRADRELPVRRSRPYHNRRRAPGRVGGRESTREPADRWRGAADGRSGENG
jgi:hypothetical protein